MRDLSDKELQIAAQSTYYSFAEGFSEIAAKRIINV